MEFKIECSAHQPEPGSSGGGVNVDKAEVSSSTMDIDNLNDVEPSVEFPSISKGSLGFDLDTPDDGLTGDRLVQIQERRPVKKEERKEHSSSRSRNEESSKRRPDPSRESLDSSQGRKAHSSRSGESSRRREISRKLEHSSHSKGSSKRKDEDSRYPEHSSHRKESSRRRDEESRRRERKREHSSLLRTEGERVKTKDPGPKRNKYYSGEVVVDVDYVMRTYLEEHPQGKVILSS